MKKYGFTLAEVLITLGIIGIVAAMTIPTLIAEQKKAQTVTKLQRAISVMNQAYRRAYDDVGEASAEEAKAMSSEVYFNTYWAPYIKAAHICKTYKDCGYSSDVPILHLNGNNTGVYLVSPNARTTFYTPDGFVYIIFTSGGSDGAAHSEIYVDINGGAKPNTLGKDIFILTRYIDNEKGGVVLPQGHNVSDTTINSNCRKGGIGNYCAEKIRRASWKIDKSYPW